MLEGDGLPQWLLQFRWSEATFIPPIGCLDGFKQQGRS
jgi:hypothetical protein